MSHTIPSNLRALAIVPVLVALGIACSDTGSTGSRPTGDMTGTTGAATTGTGGVTSGTTGAGTGAGTTGGTTTGATGTTGGNTTGGSTGTAGPATTGGTTDGAGGSIGSGGAGGAPGTGGMPGTGGTTGAGGSHFGDTSCGAGVTPVGIGRCANAPKYIVAKGTALTIANFEDPGPNNDHNAIFFGDGRAGNFIDLHTGTTGANITMSVAQTPGVAGGANTWALHYVGTATGGTSPMFAIPVADCYDSRAYKGVSFWIKGNPAAGNDHLKFQVHTPVAQPAPSGGCTAADAAAHKCDDHFAVYVPITSAWAKQTVHWADLKQNCASNIPAGYSPAQYNEMFSFALPKSSAGFDVWLDNFSFDTGIESGEIPTGSLSDIVSEATFNEMWSLAKADGTFTNLRAPFYTYQGMMTAVGGFAGFATTGSAINKRIEAAAFFSNIAHETDSLGLVEEKNCEGDHNCMQYPPNAPNGMTYHGRGPIQLTWQTNYSQAGSAIGADIVNNPDLVATDAAISWKTGFWFWMRGLSGGGTTPHDAINGGQGLGATIRIINGIECGGANMPAVMDRLRHFRRFSYMFGIDPGALANGC